VSYVPLLFAPSLLRIHAARMKFGCSQQILISFVWIAIHICYATATCYLPDGCVATGDISCSANEVMCCPASNGICLSNGLCFIPSDNVVARSSCTDQSWRESCTGYCRTSKHFPICLLTFQSNVKLQQILENFASYCLAEATSSVVALAHLQRPAALLVPAFLSLQDHRGRDFPLRQLLQWLLL
jgi:hypothetical protein